ncbi:HlyD family secretion protein [Azospirillum doebereinerae]|uniref:HlyD family secretion protein n=1 Tax=Azospirillum doebereinerae TaxID=92933 RepID=A0A433JD03_9PROT|nr:HlyD family secretion protein [Azospirillum doebereinerae]RUQ74475.1 HlyD family secretion protein [Azospirillum doebereinerae]
MSAVIDRDSPTAEKSTSATPVRRRRWRRWLLMAALPVAVALGGGYEYVVGERYVSTDNAYIQQDKVTVSPDVSGRVVAVAVHENELVARGQILFRIDDEPYRLALQQADAALASARLKVEQLRADLGEEIAKQATAAENVEFQKGEFQRQKDLLNTGVAARAKYDSVRHDLTAAERELNTAQQAVVSARAALGGDPAIPTDRHPSVLEAMAKRATAQRDLDHTVVRAPADGVVSQTDRLLIGQYMTVGLSAVSLVMNGSSWVEANFKETDLTHMEVGQTATVVIDAYSGRTLTARVESIGAGTGSEFSLLPAQNATGNWVKVVQRVPVRLRIDPSDNRDAPAVPLRTGLSAQVDVDTHFTRPLPGPIRGALAMIP